MSLTLATREWQSRHAGDPDWSLILLWFTQCTYTDPHRPSPPALTLCGEEVAVGTLATATLWRQKSLTFPHSSSLRSPPLQDGEGELGDDFSAFSFSVCRTEDGEDVLPADRTFSCSVQKPDRPTAVFRGGPGDLVGPTRPLLLPDRGGQRVEPLPDRRHPAPRPPAERLRRHPPCTSSQEAVHRALRCHPAAVREVGRAATTEPSIGSAARRPATIPVSQTPAGSRRSRRVAFARLSAGSPDLL